MNDLKAKGNGAKTVALATTTESKAQATNSKIELIIPKIENSAQNRIKNLEIFQKICEKHEFLKQKSDKLNAYLMGRDGLKETVIIENTNGITFEISNTLIISEVLVLCQSKLFELLDNSEKEVIKFNI